MALRVGIIGCGGISETHARGWQAIPEQATVTAVADVHRPSAERMAAKFPGATALEDFHELVSRSDVDAVDICLPHHLHKDAIVAAAKAGKHILCEKPLCLTVEQAYEIADAVSAGGVQFMSAHNQVFLPTIAEAKRLLQNGVLGKIYTLYSADCFVHPTNLLSDEEKLTTGRTWRSSKETMGGGELIDTGYHPTYRLLYLAPTPPIEVVAQTAKFRVFHWDEEDTAQVMLTFEDGAFGTILSSWAMPNPIGAYYFYVIGEHGQIYGTSDTLYVRLNGLTEPATRTFKPVDTFAAEIEHFADAVTFGKRPIQSLPEATNVLKVILAAYRSVETKQVVRLADLEAK